MQFSSDKPMAFILSLLIFLLRFQLSIAQPSPGYHPSSKFRAKGFNYGFRNLWGPSHQSLSRDDWMLTVWLDKSSGSGFKSNQPFGNGYFGASIKLQSGYTAGVITSFYLSNNQAHPGSHDEVDMEFLGTTPGKPYTLQTNVYVRGSGDGSNIIGREMRFHLWFDPTADFHHYAILWNPDQIVFLVDDIPIRRYPKKSSSTFPTRPMWIYGSIWDASSWATEGGRYKANYRYSPFIAKYTQFIINGCSSYVSSSCHLVTISPLGRQLSPQQVMAMKWAQKYHMAYNYCGDFNRDHRLTPECNM